MEERPGCVRKTLSLVLILCREERHSLNAGRVFDIKDHSIFLIRVFFFCFFFYLRSKLGPVVWLL